jgi:hypothetical protein
LSILKAAKRPLFVAPSGDSLLIDAGSPGGRDTDRIMAAVSEAGLKQIDYLLLTHYHVDHVGGVLPLAQRIIMQNGQRKGAAIATLQTLQHDAASPGRLATALGFNAGLERNPPGAFIANIEEPATVASILTSPPPAPGAGGGGGGGGEARGLVVTSARPSRSRSPRARMARSPSPIRATVSARPTRRRRPRPRPRHGVPATSSSPSVSAERCLTDACPMLGAVAPM